jgi:hypothetical protein
VKYRFERLAKAHFAAAKCARRGVIITMEPSTKHQDEVFPGREMRPIRPIPHGIADPIFIGKRGGCAFGLCGWWLGDIWLFALNDRGKWVPQRPLLDEEAYEVYQQFPKLEAVQTGVRNKQR